MAFSIHINLKFIHVSNNLKIATLITAVNLLLKEHFVVITIM
jgi:hypothetical protein